MSLKIKAAWEKIDQTVTLYLGLLVGFILGLAARGILLWAEKLVVGSKVLKFLFGWLF